MKKGARRLLHFLELETGVPLCGGEGREPARAAVNGVSVCAECARKMTREVERAAAARRVIALPIRS